MKWPWNPKVAEQPAPPPADDRPRLMEIEARPLKFHGETLSYEIVLVFDRKELSVGRVMHENAANVLVADMKDRLL